MELAQHSAAFRALLESLDPAAFGFLGFDLFQGATRYSRHSVVSCRLDASSATAALQAAPQAAEQAAMLLSPRLGIDLAWGADVDEAGTCACWLEYFPGGTPYDGALLAIEAIKAGLLFAFAQASGDQRHLAAAKRQMLQFERTPAADIFVQSRFIIAAARDADIPIQHVAGGVAWQFGWGAKSDIFYMTASTGDSVPGHQITWKKHVAKLVMQDLGFPTPKWCLVAQNGDALSAANAVGWPCVVKPTDQAFGTGVTANVRTPAELHTAVALARHCSPAIIVEAHEPGADYRLMVVDGRMIAAARRDPPCLTGDGKRSVGELLTELNRARDGTRENGYLLPVAEDAALAATLSGEGLSMDTVLPAGRTLVLRSVANFSTGGSATDVTAEVNPEVRRLAELLAASVGLRTAGIDYITTDISRPPAEVGGGFIEVNAMPRLRLLLTEAGSEARVGALLLGDRPARIPVDLIVVPDECAAEIAAIVRRRIAGRSDEAAVGPQWARVGPAALATASLDPFQIATAVLRNRAVERLTVQWPASEIERFGLPVDRFERGLILDASFDPRQLAPFCAEVISPPVAQPLKEALARLWPK